MNAHESVSQSKAVHNSRAASSNTLSGLPRFFRASIRQAASPGAYCASSRRKPSPMYDFNKVWYPEKPRSGAIAFMDSTTSTGIRRVIEVMGRSLSKRALSRSLSIHQPGGYSLFGEFHLLSICILSSSKSFAFSLAFSRLHSASCASWLCVSQFSFNSLSDLKDSSSRTINSAVTERPEVFALASNWALSSDGILMFNWGSVLAIKNSCVCDSTVIVFYLLVRCYFITRCSS